MLGGEQGAWVFDLKAACRSPATSCHRVMQPCAVRVQQGLTDGALTAEQRHRRGWFRARTRKHGRNPTSR